MTEILRELEALVAAALLLEALALVRVFTGKRIEVGPALWLLAVILAGGAGHLAFPETGVFLPWFAVLLVVQAARYGSGLLKPEAGILDRLKYFAPAALAVLVRSDAVTVFAFLFLLLTRRNVRYVLFRIASSPLPSGISASDVDHILPEPIRYRRERGMSLLEATVSLTLLVVIGSTVCLAAANRAIRLRHVRETQAARETATSVLEAALADDYSSLEARDGETFRVPGGSEPGRLQVTEIDEGLLEVRVTVPRRGAVPVELATLRAGRKP